MNAEEQQATLTEVAPILTLIDPQFCVAGGAPRDWHMGRACKDVNIFLRPVKAFSGNLQTEVSDPLSMILGVEATVKQTAARKDSILARVLFNYEGLDFQLNFLDASIKKPSRIISEFDLDICAIEYDLDTQMPVPTKQFFKSVRDKEITYLPETKEGSPRHLRMKELFPEFTHKFLKEEDKAASKKRKKIPEGDFNFSIEEGQVVEFGGG